MHECYFSKSLEILIDQQFIFVNLLNFWGKQRQVAFMLSLEKVYKRWL